MKWQVTLDYTLSEGWLAPFVDGLRAGVAMASRCDCCGQAEFPPLRICPTCRVPVGEWVTLSGAAEVVLRTTGSDGDIVMARFEGARGAAILRAEHLPAGAGRGVLAPCPEGPPILSLIAETPG